MPPETNPDILLDPVARAAEINRIREMFRSLGIDALISGSEGAGDRLRLGTLSDPLETNRILEAVRALNIPSLANPEQISVNQALRALADAEEQSYGLIMDPRDAQAAAADLATRAADLRARTSTLWGGLTFDVGGEAEIGQRTLAIQLEDLAERATQAAARSPETSIGEQSAAITALRSEIAMYEDLIASGEIATADRTIDTSREDEAIALGRASRDQAAEDRRVEALRYQRSLADNARQEAVANRRAAIDDARQQASLEIAQRGETRDIESGQMSRDLEVQTRIDDAITAYFGTATARAEGLAELRARPDPGAIAQLAATVAVQAQGVGQALGVPISTKTVVDAVQGSLGLLGKPLRGAVTQAATAAGVSRPTSAAMATPPTPGGGNRQAAPRAPTAAASTTRPLSTRTTGTVIRPTGTVRPAGASVPRRSTEPGDIADELAGEGQITRTGPPSRANPLTQGARVAPNFGGPSSGGGAIIGGPTQAIQGAYGGLANRVRDPADPMTAAEAAQIFGYITNIGDAMLGPGGWQDIGVDPEVLIGSLAGLTTDEAAARTDQILTLLEQQRRERVQQAEAERQRAADEAESALDRTESTRRFDLQQQDQQAGRRFQARQEMNTTSQQRAAMMNSIAQGITSARTGFIGDLFQNASHLAPPTPGARMGGANIYDDLLARIGAPNAGFAQIGGPVAVPDFSADFAQALAEATALGQGQTVESLVA